jgi:hypothetical protein
VLSYQLLPTVRGVALSAFLALFGCGLSQRDKAGPAAEQSPVSAATAPAKWERVRQCAEQADRLATRLKWQGEDVSWGSHYNSKQQRCFVDYTRFNAEKMMVFEELYDGFEGVALADSQIESRGMKRTVCNLTAHPWTDPLSGVNCNDYARLLQDRMEN